MFLYYIIECAHRVSSPLIIVHWTLVRVQLNKKMALFTGKGRSIQNVQHLSHKRKQYSKSWKKNITKRLLIQEINHYYTWKFLNFIHFLLNFTFCFHIKYFVRQLTSWKHWIFLRINYKSNSFKDNRF